MRFPLCVKNDFMSVKETASFKTRHLAVEFILLGGLCFARVTVPLLLTMKTCIRLCTYVCHSLTTSNYIYPVVSCTVMVVCLAVCFAKSIIFVNDSNKKIQM